MTHEPADDQVIVGVVTGAWGLQGDVKVELHTPSTDRFSPGSQLFLDGRLVTVQQMRAHRNHLVIKLDVIQDRDKAESLGGHFLTIPEEQLHPLPDDQFYHFELLEMSVYSDDETFLGTLSEIITTPGNDVYVVQKPGFRDLLLPALASVVLAVDVPGKRMMVRLLEGLEQSEATIPKRKRRAERKRAGASKDKPASEPQTTQPD
ncbi:MAG: ribosome maturation factor RimM [SAR202 cluster bacterium]|mgnify:CR=1 FL=1|jgi:16S rRNA processing protein RimM|nr:ribosome maturation factor RimM [SAR202 cluster bacterium]MDP6713137.1 ribosome maturation factor RimM [SAR202 cluster bacterium]